MAVERYPFCHVRYFCGNIHADKDEDWDRCEVSPVSSYSTYGTQSFTRDEIYKRDALLHLLEQAFHIGRADKAREVRRVLEV